MRAEHRLHLPQTVSSGLQRPDRATESGLGDPGGLSRWKRLTDIVIASISLVLTAPLCLLAAVAIKLTSPGPVLFRQERVGLDRRRSDRRRRSNPSSAERRNGDRRRFVKFGKPFTMYKFRTMRNGAEGDQPQWARPGDPRVTAVGRFLRRTRIDEIPQFINVLRGDMSVVGPRPERSFFIASHDREVPDFKLRLRTKPGITGLAQVHVGYANTVEGMKEKLDFDLEYIRQLSPVTDLRIMLRTVMVVVTGKGAC
jgi:lipopolysaccharide/colanic/teichoic acid biosynthesis glycosyltransferase